MGSYTYIEQTDIITEIPGFEAAKFRDKLVVQLRAGKKMVGEKEKKGKGFLPYPLKALFSPNQLIHQHHCKCLRGYCKRCYSLLPVGFQEDPQR